MDTTEEKLLRRRALRGMRPHTITTYVRCRRRFAAHFGRSALEHTMADVCAYLEHLRVGERLALATHDAQQATAVRALGFTCTGE